MRKIICLLLISAAVMLVSGCRSDLGVNHTGMEAWVINRSENSLSTDHLSRNTIDFLLREGLYAAFNDEPVETLETLSEELKNTKHRKLLAALIELTYFHAKHCSDREDAVFYYLSACVYAYEYLFKDDFEGAPSPYEPEFLFACRYYNYSAAAVFRYLKDKNLLLTHNVNMPFLNGFINLRPSRNFLPRKLGEYKTFEICYEYNPYGFYSLTRQSGLGVPLIATGGSDKVARDKNGFLDVSNVAYPATVFLRFKTPEKGKLTMEMDYYDPLNTYAIKIHEREVPLEVDISSYLGWILKSGPAYSPIHAMMDTSIMDKFKGLYLMTPYNPDKIPVVFVHGVLSYPRTWVQTMNNLLQDPQIRKHYQFWLFAYPSGNPVLYSAMNLRRDLLNAQKAFDPKHKNRKFNNMVIVGHSMGGLLTKIMVQNSGNALLKTYLGTGKTLEDYNLTDEQKNFVKEVLVYKRLSFIDMVIFISVPHRGSEMTRWWVAELAAKLVNIPGKLANDIYNIQKKILVRTGLKKENDPIHISTGVDNLDPDNKVIKITSQIPIDKHVVYHSIIGNIDKAGVPGGTDGIVPYTSSHLDGAASELIIKSDHSAHEKPAAIKEIRRLLLDHLKKVERK